MHIFQPDFDDARDSVTDAKGKDKKTRDTYGACPKSDVPVPSKNEK